MVHQQIPSSLICQPLDHFLAECSSIGRYHYRTANDSFLGYSEFTTEFLHRLSLIGQKYAMNSRSVQQVDDKSKEDRELPLKSLYVIQTDNCLSRREIGLQLNVIRFNSDCPKQCSADHGGGLPHCLISKATQGSLKESGFKLFLRYKSCDGQRNRLSLDLA
jgi:hypothetical protein